ncbi:hypothetical protein HK104_000695, partial [Borealophlyctis nickersoniae]
MIKIVAGLAFIGAMFATMAAGAPDPGMLGGSGMALQFASLDWYPRELSYRTLIQKGVFSEQQKQVVRQR